MPKFSRSVSLRQVSDGSLHTLRASLYTLCSFYPRWSEGLSFVQIQFCEFELLSVKYAKLDMHTQVLVWCSNRILSPCPQWGFYTSSECRECIIFREALDTMFSTCKFHFRSSWIVIPNNFPPSPFFVSDCLFLVNRVINLLFCDLCRLIYLQPKGVATNQALSLCCDPFVCSYCVEI